MPSGVPYWRRGSGIGISRCALHGEPLFTSRHVGEPRDSWSQPARVKLVHRPRIEFPISHLAAPMLNAPAYLARIAYAGPTPPTIDTLRSIHRAHLQTVPFENLDIALGRTIVVDEDATVRKIVEQHRGGFCYEMNGAFAALLRALGFRVTLLSARVARPQGGEGPEFDHLTLRVDLEEPWLADVGFGESFPGAAADEVWPGAT